MPLPSVEQFIGTNVTEQGFKDAQKQLVEYVGNEVPKKADTDADFATKANKATTLAGYGIADAYTKAQVDSSIAAVSGGHKAYQTLALAQAAQATLPVNSVVEITNDGANNGTYQWNGTTLTKSAYDPLNQAKSYTDTKTESILEETPQDYEWSVLDKFGNTTIGVNKDGSFVAENIITTQSDINMLNGQNVKYLRDKNRNVANLNTEMAVILSCGQSLSPASNAVFPVNTVSKYADNVMLNTGVIYSTTTATSLVPAVSVPNIEPPILQAANTVRDLIAAEERLSENEYTYGFALSATGAGSTSIAGLSKGTEPYSRNITVLSKFKELGNAQNKIVKCLGWFWTQGEQDYVANTTKAAYKNSLSQLINDLNADIKATTKQVDAPKVISYQTRNFTEKAQNPVIALAQLELSNERNDYFMACPMYHILRLDGLEDVHPDGRGYAILGAYYGLVYKRTVIDGEDWKPLQPLKADAVDNIALVNFHVPVGKLVIDTTLLTQKTNYGFRVSKSDGSDYTITNVEVINSNTVKIQTSENIASGSVVKYGQLDGYGGNLRDEQGNYLTVNPVGADYPLHNWCVISQISIDLGA